jgi:NAD(P)-dependent dehydrogenase (short-subunit alcohol dehydrogenase family)
MTDLRGKTALVTGSTSGIGKATAIALAARGAHVLVVGRNEQRAKDVVAEIEGSGGSATYRITSLSDLKSAQDLVEWATEAGDGHVDILINNAGVAVMGPSNLATEAEFDESFGLNVRVPFFLVASLAPAMAERGWGFDRQPLHDGRELRTARYGFVWHQPSGSRTVDEGLVRRIRHAWCSGECRCPRPDAHPDDGSSPRRDGESTRRHKHQQVA